MEGKRGNYIALAVTLSALGALLLCSQAALESARAGLNLCAQMIVPSLLPFFILEGMPEDLDCASCSFKPVCDEVEGLKELHFGKAGKKEHHA